MTCTPTKTAPDWGILPETLVPSFGTGVVGPALYWDQGGEELLTHAVQVLSTCYDKAARTAILRSLEASTVYDQDRCWDLLDETSASQSNRILTGARLAILNGAHRSTMCPADRRREAKRRKKVNG